MATSVMNGLGQALRWLRDRIGKKQYQVAAAAGVTKGMLSAYETGRQKPSLDTLEKLLNTLGCDLHDLHSALEIVNGRPGIVRQAEVSTAKMGAVWDRGFPDLYSVLGQSQPLPPELEIYPGHQAGSACGAGLSGKPASTIGFEKRFNPMLSMSRDEFVAALTAEIPPQPADMASIVAANLRGVAPEPARP